jgi:phospholipid-translocating ATPase
MELKKLHIGTVSYSAESMEEVSKIILDQSHTETPLLSSISSQRGRREVNSRVRDAVFSLAVCHNVTPTLNELNVVQYQAASPDEIAIIQWIASLGLHLIHRDRHTLHLKSEDGTIFIYDILNIFPFTSANKRMGIVIRDSSGELWFIVKGADIIMQKILMANDWMEEECSNMAREGLRTLVIGRRRLAKELWAEFEEAFRLAELELEDRDTAKEAVIAKYLEYNLEILGITGVEDKLQENIKPSLELLRNAGIRIWMLTGDKIETARCVAVSSKLVARGQYIHMVTKGFSYPLNWI